jgi:hypothetical protein
MRPSVDSDRVPTPGASVSTAENIITTSPARRLIKELTMRQLSLATVLLASACMAPVGGGEGDGRSKKDDTGCKNPDTVVAPLTIRSDADFAGLPTGCYQFQAKLRIEGAGITSLAKLGKLEGVDNLELVDTNLTTIDSELPITVWGALTVSGNKQLQSLAKLTVEDSEATKAALTVRNNAALTTLDSIKYTQVIEADLRIDGNPLLADITLDELTYVGGAVAVTNNGITRLDLGSLQTVQRLEVTGNTKLTTFDGLAASTIAGDFILRGNTALATLGAMSSVTRVNGAMTIDGNGLKNLDAFSGMQYIASTFAVTNNPALETLGRMSYLQGIGATVTITGNASLPYCLGHEVDHCVNSGLVTVTNNKANTQNLACVCHCAPN